MGGGCESPVPRTSYLSFNIRVTFLFALQAGSPIYLPSFLTCWLGGGGLPIPLFRLLTLNMLYGFEKCRRIVCV